MTDVQITQTGPIRTVAITRATRRNALSRSVVAGLTAAFADLQTPSETRVVILSGDGPAFCAGGDIAEYVEAAAAGTALADAAALADLLALIAGCPAPVIARVHGPAIGGGVGLVCAADIAIAAESARFSLSEARLGLVPAVISPYVVAALGGREARAKMLLAAPFGADEALRCGLVHRIIAADGLDAAIEEMVDHLLHGAPGALATIKRIPRLLDQTGPEAARAVMTALLAERLASAEGQEGLRAFLEKRPPSWAPVDETA